MEDAHCLTRAQITSNGPEFSMEDDKGQARVQDKPDGQESHMEDVDDHTSIQNDAEGTEFHKAGVRTARQARGRQPLWQWNRIHEGRPYNHRRKAFSENKEVQVPLPTNAAAEDFFKLYIHEGINDHLVRETNLCAQQYIAKEGDNLISIPLFSQLISRDKFLLLLRFLYFVDYETIIYMIHINTSSTKSGKW